VDGRRIHAPERPVYIAINKPKNFVTTVSDPEGRATVMDLLRGVKARVYPVGRLDYHSEGLLLLTNDGEFAKRITSAATHVAKIYLAKPMARSLPNRKSSFGAASRSVENQQRPRACG
jgi:23S rRNA pseudouridine2605 synthase